jgi:hypothetical protein
MKAEGEREVLPYSFLNLDARWEWVVNATPRPLYPLKETLTHCNRVGKDKGFPNKSIHHNKDIVVSSLPPRKLLGAHFC